MKLLFFFLVIALTKEKKKNFKAPPQKQVQFFLPIPLINFILISHAVLKSEYFVIVFAFLHVYEICGGFFVHYIFSTYNSVWKETYLPP